MMYLYSLLTILAFSIAVWINKRVRSLIFNSFVISLLLLIAFLLISGQPYADYYAGNQPLNLLLSPVVVALALPLYQQLPQIKHYWRLILLVIIVASVSAMISGTVLALCLGGDLEIMATMLPKSVTTPIAVEIANNVGGVPAVTAVLIVVAGLTGSILGYPILRLVGVKRSEAIGLAIGSASHALGTAVCMERDPKAGVYSSMALVLCGISSSLLAPLVFKLLVAIVY
ncbi:CidB/LrgB family autolysis modulator [Mergibacter septicus]|uniref:CidB/LrgB family autolysis modulator n=1 Tax=Mergibacter septicus TaxID=221402 RepID=A0A8D4LKJ6_9PAST|nr:CidB/LrgB family autolysis modulator [Mergibacter septicus]AWX15965.1 CidB/LrgB family autolysis modulator [Mergibacter septicus]QDJ15218.1 CidB/LrgB family autolysis modulator [Mergibacter septicus]UTU47362.1 CidB/LrgB family autolysis modulator [Mergibacter septicus]WMR95458.1 CidB/LrgB family autolysis modulator [Mergibacter septicus]